MSLDNHAVIGIDFGTTKSFVAICQQGHPEIIVNQEGDRATPSIVSLVEGNEPQVGVQAQRLGVSAPENTIRSVKRLLGRRKCESSDEEHHSLKFVSQQDDGFTKIACGGRTYWPTEIASYVFRKLRRDAEAQLGHTVTRAGRGGYSSQLQ